MKRVTLLQYLHFHLMVGMIMSWWWWWSFLDHYDGDIDDDHHDLMTMMMLMMIVMKFWKVELDGKCRNVLRRRQFIFRASSDEEKCSDEKEKMFWRKRKRKWRRKQVLTKKKVLMNLFFLENSFIIMDGNLSSVTKIVTIDDNLVSMRKYIKMV